MSLKVKVDSQDMIVVADPSNAGAVIPASTSGAIPTGGATDAILHKLSGTNFDLVWRAKATTVADLTDSTGGVPSATLVVVRSDTAAHTAADAIANDASLNAQIKAITDALKAAKLMA